MDNIQYSVRPGNYPKSGNSFDGKSFGALASGLLGSTVGLGLNSIASNITQANQLDMLHESNRLQRSNMQFANDLTRKNAIDTPKLNRLGMEGAGFNVNAEKGFSPIAGQSGLGSSGSGAQMSPVDLASFTSAMANAKLAQSQAKNLDEDTQGKKIDNANKQQGYDLSFANLEATTDKLLKEIDNVVEMTEYQRLQNSRYNEITDAELKYTIAKTDDANWSAKERQEHIDVFKAQVRNFDASTANIKADTSLAPYKRRELIARAYMESEQGLNAHWNANVSYMDWYTYFDRIIPQINKDTNAANMSEVEKELMATQLLIAAKDLDWYTFDKVCQALNCSLGTGAKVWSAVRGKH